MLSLSKHGAGVFSSLLGSSVGTLLTRAHCLDRLSGSLRQVSRPVPAFPALSAFPPTLSVWKGLDGR